MTTRRVRRARVRRTALHFIECRTLDCVAEATYFAAYGCMTPYATGQFCTSCLCRMAHIQEQLPGNWRILVRPLM